MVFVKVVVVVMTVLAVMALNNKSQAYYLNSKSVFLSWKISVILKTANTILRHQLLHVNTELHEASFGANVIANNDDKTCFYTGLPRFGLFLTLFDIVKPYFRSQNKTENTLFACLVKLRLNPPFKDLAYRYKLHLASVSKSFHVYRHFVCQSSTTYYMA